MVVGPPGTGKTDTAVQILNVLYHNCPSQRTLIITHSNQALNDLFEKIMEVSFHNHVKMESVFYGPRTCTASILTVKLGGNMFHLMGPTIQWCK